MYPPGYPMAMALAERVAGRDAVCYVVPLLGGLAVWATFLMARRLAGPWIGLGAATLLAVSPSFRFQLQTPMSDVPATRPRPRRQWRCSSGTNAASRRPGGCFT
jgi:hypothetical protein